MNPQSALLAVAALVVVGIVILGLVFVIRRLGRRRHTPRSKGAQTSESGCTCETPVGFSCEPALRCIDAPQSVIIDGATCDRGDAMRMHASVLQLIANDYAEQAREKKTREAYTVLQELAAERIQTPKRTAKAGG